MPLIDSGTIIGILALSRQEVRPFSDKQIALLQAFAIQAQIAMKNARLMNETREALERQTATAEILKVIAESPDDVQPVFDAIAERARLLCGAQLGSATRFDGEWIHLLSYRGVSPEAEAEMRAAFSGQARAWIHQCPSHRKRSAGACARCPARPELPAHRAGGERGAAKHAGRSDAPERPGYWRHRAGP